MMRDDEMFYPSGDDVDQLIEAAIQCGIDNRGTSWPVKLCRLRAKVRAELCRASPAGGDVSAHVMNLAYMRGGYNVGLPERNEALDAAIDALRKDSAPAGSGEVEELRAWKAEHQAFLVRLSVALVVDGGCKEDKIESCVAELIAERDALLRKLQQGAE